MVNIIRTSYKLNCIIESNIDLNRVLPPNLFCFLVITSLSGSGFWLYIRFRDVAMSEYHCDVLC